MLLLIVSALLMGIILGLLGGGGAIVTVPVLVYVAKLSPKQAIATALGIVAITAAVSGFREWRAGRVHFQKVFPFAFSGMAGSFLGAQVATLWLSEAVQMVLFAVVVVFAALSMIRGALKAKVEISPARKSRVSVLVAAGFGVGVMSGVLGVGGGFLIVPALVMVAGLSMKEAVANSLVIIAMSSTTGTLGYLGKVEIAWGMLALFAGAGVVGSLAGTALRHRVPEKELRLGFAVFLLLLGTYIGIRYLFPDLKL